MFVTAGAASGQERLLGAVCRVQGRARSAHQDLRHEVASTPLRVNLVNPGPVRTQMRAKAFPGEDPMTLPAPEDVVPLFLDLVSPQCTFNGCVVSFREWQKPKLSVPANSDD